MLLQDVRLLICLLLAICALINMTAFASPGDEVKPHVSSKEGKAKMGNTYYVDATGGSDSNDGISPKTPWKTIEKANLTKLNPGDSVLLKRGEFWREQLVPQSGDETGYITYGAYGTGNKPLILGSVTRNDADDWKHEGGNIWATGSADLRGGEMLANSTFEKDAAEWSLHHEGGANVAGSRDTSVYDTPPASYKIECRASGEASNHIQFYTSGISVERGNYYKLSFRAKSTKEFAIGSIVLMKSGPPWTNYSSRRSPNRLAITGDWKTYEILFRANRTDSDGRINFFLGKALPEGAVFHIDSISFRKCMGDDLLFVDVGNIIFNNEESVGVKVWNEEDLDSQGKFWYDEDNWVLKMYSETNPAVHYSNIECALKQHIIDESGKSYAIYENLDLKYGAAHGIGGSSTHHIIVRDCDLSYIGGADQRGGEHTVRYGNAIEFWENAHDNLVERCRIWEVYDAALTNQGSSNNSQINIRYQNNIIWNCEYSFEYWNRGEESTTRDIYFENNTCVNAGYGWGHSQRADPNGRHLMFYNNTAKTSSFYVRNNIFYESTDSCLRFGNDWSRDLTMDYNCWYESQGVMIWWDKKYGMDQFAAYQTEKGQDKHSIAANPRFADAENLDFRPAAGSPVCNMAENGGHVGAVGCKGD